MVTAMPPSTLDAVPNHVRQSLAPSPKLISSLMISFAMASRISGDKVSYCSLAQFSNELAAFSAPTKFAVPAKVCKAPC
ncbi:hypothetical protein UF38_10335 [Vibrio parahaemolyticus]|nr:hypothetical protein UF30_09045 [Vibrio parahaemolyticus]KKX66370.1 hypothetical protein UF33_13520 [Vibrio parahaemolyticus]KKX88096.1 hypothetical protein UF38_10335 [Vibrio parahaemolyticus]